MDLSKIQSIVFIEYRNNGYLEMWNKHNILDRQDSRIRDIAELGLISTEISEAIESVRNFWKEDDDNKIIDSDFSDLAKECADIIIRTLNFMSRKGFNAEKIIQKNGIKALF
jgi:hypothetical protein